jgi:hypothetical protein
MFSFAKSPITSWHSATSHKACITNCKSCLSLLSHHLQLNTATETCSHFHQLLTFYMFWSLLPSNVHELTYNIHCFSLVTSILIIARETGYRQICYYLLCVNCAVLITAVKGCSIVSKECRMISLYGC